MSLCRAAHDRISAWHQGAWVPSVAIFAVSWAVVAWARFGVALARLRRRGAS